MASSLCLILASTPVAVPDSGISGFLLGIGLLSVGIVARLVKNRKR